MELRNAYLPAEQIRGIAQSHGIGRRIDRHDEHRLSPGVAQAFALADRVMDQPPVRTDGPAFEIHEIARRSTLSCSVAFDHLRVVSVRHEADILAVGFVRVHEAVLRRDLPHRVLR